MSMGRSSAARPWVRTVSMARAVSMAVMQATECSTVERRILKPSVSWRRPRVGVLMNMTNLFWMY